VRKGRVKVESVDQTAGNAKRPERRCTVTERPWEAVSGQGGSVEVPTEGLRRGIVSPAGDTGRVDEPRWKHPHPEPAQRATEAAHQRSA